jgi:beta-glucosidase
VTLSKPVSASREREHVGRSVPAGFVLGAATASYQIEGAIDEDGRKPSIWDTFSHTPGRIITGENGDYACDHYHRMPEDVALLADLGVDAYRFSVSWTRVIPDGIGSVNPLGVDFYSRLVDTLLDRGITPLLTLYHWDLPQPLEDLGGWTNRATAERFAEFATVIGQAFGDRVHTFTTLNEPWCSAFLGYGAGVHAPGHTDNAKALAAAHHLNLAHGLGSSALRAVLPSDAQIALTLNPARVVAASDRPEDVAAARHVDMLANDIFLKPVFEGHYPEQLQADLGHITDWAFIQDGDLARINMPPDLLGINYYAPARIAAPTPDLTDQIKRRWTNDPAVATGPSRYPGTDLAVAVPQEGPYTAMGWPIDAGSFTDLLVDMYHRCGRRPLMITENGAAYDDEVSADGAVHDSERTAYLRDHFAAVLDAVDAGADVRGYLVWSLLDNFEWAWGFSMRFGIVHVDFPTGERRLKDSARWFAATIKNRAVA